MRTQKSCACILFALAVGFSPLTANVSIWAIPAPVQGQGSMTPLQLEIERQRVRLSSGDVEERRDGVTRLGSMHHPDASRAALPALKDPMPIVRATAAVAILNLPAEESSIHLVPLLSDKAEFVRREAAYALGRTRSGTAVPFLVEHLNTDKEDGVRAAAAVALGQIGNQAAVLSLSSVLDPQLGSTEAGKKKKRRKEQNPFVLRAAVNSLGQIKSSVAVPVLIALLGDEKAHEDVRREAANALGMIGDTSAIPALQSVLNSADPYLAEAAYNAVRRLSKPPVPGGH